MTKLRILIVCESASNQFGGEAMLPFKYFNYLKELDHEVYLLTHSRSHESIDSVMNVIYIRDTRAQVYLHQLGTYLPERVALVTTGVLSHYITQIYQHVYARRIVKSKKIDLIHEPAPVSPKQPSMMFALGVPVIIGPMNGGMVFPKPFKYMAGNFERALQRIVRFASHIFNIVTPGKLLASRLLVANQRTKDALPYFYFGRVIEIVENAADEISSDDSMQKYKKDPSEKINVLFVGRLVDWKAIDILLEVFSDMDEDAFQFDIVGDGPEMAKLQLLAQNLNNVTFHGWVEHTKVNDFYDKADIFVLPSVRECGGAVVLEAMARGVPTIATNWGGPADYIAEGTGILVDPTSRAYMVDAFKNQIEMLAKDPEKRMIMGTKAKAHVQANFLWQEKVKKMIELYREVIAE
jgi:glycosyltransferase involved in cell wall biosynthesis